MRTNLSNLRLVSAMLAMLFSSFADGALHPIEKVGSGFFAWMETDGNGSVHVVYDGKYRTGKSLDSLEVEELVMVGGSAVFVNPKIAVDASGVPHVVFQDGRTGSAKRCYYTTRKDGEWTELEKFADIAEIATNPKRTMLPDVSADSVGRVLVCFWASENESELGNAIYRWRDTDGQWSDCLGGLSSYHAASPKVEFFQGNYYLHYAKNDYDKMLDGPISFGGRFGLSDTDFNSRKIERSFQNEGVNFIVGEAGLVVAAGNFRQTKSGGGVGIWVSDNSSGEFEAKIIAELPGSTSEGKGEGHQQPDLAIDRESGDVYISYFDDSDKKAYFAVKTGDSWSAPQRICPESEGMQGYFRCGPSIADVPGLGVVACFVDDGQVYLRKIDREL